MASENNTARDIRRIRGRLHVIDEVRDEAGKAITRRATAKQQCQSKKILQSLFPQVSYLVIVRRHVAKQYHSH